MMKFSMASKSGTEAMLADCVAAEEIEVWPAKEEREASENLDGAKYCDMDDRERGKNHRGDKPRSNGLQKTVKGLQYSPFGLL